MTSVAVATSRSFEDYAAKKAVRINDSDDDDKYVLFCYGNNGYTDYMHNLLISLTKLNLLERIAIVCTDTGAFETMTALGYDAFLYDEWLYVQKPPTEFVKYAGGRQDKWSPLMAAKMEITFRLLQLGYHVLYTDGDIVWQRDCIEDLVQRVVKSAQTASVAFMNDGAGRGQHICAGFFFARPSEVAKRIFDPSTITWSTFDNDQDYINRLVRSNGHLKREVLYLPFEIYCNGYVWVRNAVSKSPFVVHFNYMIGDKKKARMQSDKMWFV